MINYDTSLTVNKKQLKSLNNFWLGFIVYTFSGLPSNTTYVSIVICQGVQIIGVILMAISIIYLIQFKFDNQYLKFIYILYCAWLFTLLLKGFQFLTNYSYLKDFLFNPYEGMLYFAPLVLLFPRNLVFYKKVFDVIAVCGIFYIIYNTLFIKQVLSADRSSVTGTGIVETLSDLSFSSGFVVLTYAYHHRKRQWLALGVVSLAFFFAVIRARRGLTLMYTEIVLVSYILYVFHSKMKFLIIYLTAFIALLGVFYVSGVYRPHENRLFGSLLERGNENTRERVELYFQDDMKTKDWIMGRGIRGEYFCPDVEENQLTNYRQTIETGYKQTILKGGLISLGLFLLIAVPAILKGLFFSKNILSKIAAIWIVMCLINSYPGTVNAFTLQYLLVWMSIGICYSKNIRNLRDDDLKKLFQAVT